MKDIRIHITRETSSKNISIEIFEHCGKSLIEGKINYEDFAAMLLSNRPVKLVLND